MTKNKYDLPIEYRDDKFYLFGEEVTVKYENKTCIISYDNRPNGCMKFTEHEDGETCDEWSKKLNKESKKNTEYKLKKFLPFLNCLLVDRFSSHLSVTNNKIYNINIINCYLVSMALDTNYHKEDINYMLRSDVSIRAFDGQYYSEPYFKYKFNQLKQELQEKIENDALYLFSSFFEIEIEPVVPSTWECKSILSWKEPIDNKNMIQLLLDFNHTRYLQTCVDDFIISE